MRSAESLQPSSPEKRVLPSLAVRNEVVFANKDIAYPFKIEQGKETNLGLFVTNPSDQVESDMDLGVDEMHHRSGHLAKVEFKDNYGTVFHDVDLKGMGLIDKSIDNPTPHVFEPAVMDDAISAWGIWNKDKAFREKEITEDLSRQGVRTNRIIGIIKLGEIVLPDGKKINIEEARKRGMVPQGVDPVIGIRAYRQRERLYHEEGKSLRVFEEAKSNIEHELGKELTWEEYTKWFAQTLGENLAKIHNAGYWHGFLSAHNVTMACEIIDFGAYEGSKKLADELPKERNHILNRDFDEAKTTALQVLLHKMKELNLIANEDKRYYEILETVYADEINDEYKKIIKFKYKK